MVETVTESISKTKDEWIQQFLLDKARNDYNCYAAAREKTGFERGEKEATEKVPITAFLFIFSVTLFKNYRKRTLKILRSEVFQWAREKYGREQGERIGREQGEKAGIYKTAKNLKELGIDVGTIQKATGLSAEEIASL